MRILQSTAFYLPSVGGIQEYVSQLTQALAARGHRVDVLTVSTDGGPRSEVSPAGRVRRCRLDRSYHRGLVSRELAVALLRARRYDILHLHIPFPFGLEVAAVASRINGIPLILTHHGTGTKDDAVYTIVAGAYDRLFRTVSLPAARRIVFLTESYRKSLKLPPKVMQRTVIVPTGVDLHRFRPDSEGTSVRQKLGITAAAAVALWVGSLSEHNRYKGVDVLLRAIGSRRMENLHLLIVGDGSLKSELEVQANGLGVGARVTFAGAVPHEELPAYYAAADFLVLPSVRGPENAPLVIFEAMASGKPVIATALPGVSEIIGASNGGIVVAPGDSAALAEAIRGLANDPDLRQRLGINGRSAAEQQSWASCAAQMEDIYRSIGDGATN